MTDVKECVAEERRMRKVAFAAVVMSTVAVVAAVISLPLVYSYVQSLQTHLQERSEECRVSLIATRLENVFYMCRCALAICTTRWKRSQL